MTAKTATTYRCARCNRELRKGRWVYSRATGNRYCMPGSGCSKTEVSK